MQTTCFKSSHVRFVQQWTCGACWVGMVLLGMGGCREQPTTVQGKVTLDGKPLVMGKDMRGTVVFQPTAASGTTLSGLIDAKGHYQLSSGGSKSVAPSVYWVTVSATELVPATAGGPPTGRSLTPPHYASPTDSGFRIEVAPGVNEINLPLVSDPPAADAGEPATADPTESVESANSSEPKENAESRESVDSPVSLESTKNADTTAEASAVPANADVAAPGTPVANDPAPAPASDASPTTK